MFTIIKTSWCVEFGRVSAAAFGSTEDNSAQPATMVMVVVRRGTADFCL